ncbi:MAG: cell division protein FtsX [Bacteroidia bacterium]|nr:cell division protein FtsX [Bacteroidia bacterium]
MGKNLEIKLIRRRLRSAYITTTVSISLVLFMLGIMGLLILNARKLSDYVKENIGFSVILNDDAKEADVLALQKNLDATQYVKSTEYISKEKAASELQAELDEDFIKFLGFNPLLASINVHLYAEYANPDSLKTIEKNFQQYPQVKEVFYQKNLLYMLNENVKKISVIILLFSAMLFIISFTLINNTIRLVVYSKRFIINTMRLVGATSSFIRRPFIFRSTVQGLLGALLAIVMLTCFIFLANHELKDIGSIVDEKIIGILFFLVVVFGILITGVSTYFAVNKYIRITADELYL